MTRKEGEFDFPAAAYAYVPDAEKPSTWKLRLWETPTDKATARQVGMAVAALGPEGFRGNRVEIPSEALPAVKQKVLAAWKQVHPNHKPEDVPNIIKGGTTTMTMEELSEQLTTLEKAQKELETALTAANARADTAEAELAVAKLSEDDRAAFDALSADDQATFRKSADQRTALLAKGAEEVAKRAKEPEVPEAIRKQMEDLTKRTERAEAKATAAEEVAKREVDARRMVELTKRAEDEFPGLPGTPVEKANVLKSLEKLTEAERGEVEKLLKAGNACLHGQMTSVGKGGNDEAAGGTAWAKIEKKADDIQKQEPKLSRAKAITKATTDNPELYEQYLREQKENGGR